MGLENKQRVIGVIVLIAFIVLLIPFLFTSGFKKKSQVTTSAVEIPATPESTSNVVESVTPANKAVALEEIKPSSASSISDKLPEGQPAGYSEILTESNQVIPPEIETGSALANIATNTQAVANITANTQTTVNADVEESTVNESTATPVVSETKKKVTTNKRITAKKKSAKAFWSVQVGSFSNQAWTQKMVTNLQKHGYHVYLQKITTSKGPMVRVLVGHETSKAKAVKISDQLKRQLNISGQIMKSRK